MKHIILILLFISATSLHLTAQKYFTRGGQVSFHSKALLEDINAFNKQGTFVLDSESGQIQMAVLIKAFHFEKALMQEHFNENYMESDKYPKATFKGKIKDRSSFNLQKDGSYPVDIEGSLTIRGISKPISTKASISVSSSELTAKTTFSVRIADFNIKIPSVVKDKIAKEVEVKIDVSLEEM